MPGDTSGFTRLLRLLLLIQGSRRWNVAALSGELGVVERTVYRDLQRLKDAGVPVSYDEATLGYAIAEPFFLPPVDLTADEAAALLLLTERVGGAEALPMSRPAASAMYKLRAALPAGLREGLDALMPRVTVHLASTEGDAADDVWSVVSYAIAHRRRLTCRYAAVHGQDTGGTGGAEGAEPFLLDPYDLYFGQRAWYVVGQHHGRHACRTLRLSRFERCDLTEARFTIPDTYGLSDHLGQAWRMVPGDRVRRRIRVRFSRDVADTVAETRWHATQQEHWHADGSATLTFEIDGLDEIIWWILGYGPHCVVEEPAELRERIQALLIQAGGNYANH